MFALFLMFIGSQVVEAGYPPEKASFLEGLALGLLIGSLYFIMWSDGMYYKNNLKINYKLYQVIGLIVTALSLVLYSIGFYNSWQDTIK